MRVYTDRYFVYGRDLYCTDRTFGKEIWRKKYGQ